ncbi:MAG: hypothetical protein HYZ53_08765 [Planctomycetes bacterium]|nr:hypothetical protein [Planctomycetota bacterium]
MRARILRIVRWLFWRGLLLSAVGLILWTIANFAAVGSLRTVLEKLSADGFAVELRSLAPAAVAPAENAARYYTAAGALWLPEPDAQFTIADRALRHGFRALPDDERAAVRVWLQANAEALGLAHAARSLKRCNFDVKYDLGFEIPLPHLAVLRRLTKALAVRAQVAVAEGDGAGARDAIRDAFAASEALREEPILISQLVRYACANTALAGLGQCVTAETSEGELRGWLESLPADDTPDASLSAAMRGELALLAETVSAASGKLVRDFEWAMDWSQPRGLLDDAGVTVLLPVLRWDAIRALEYERRMVELVKRSWPDGRKDALAWEREALAGSRWLHPVSNTLLGSGLTPLRARTNGEARLATTRAGLECEFAWSRDGRYPERVQARDPFTGGQLQARPEKGLLYSLGPNGVDDGGVGEDSGGGGSGGADDVVWKLRHSP